MITKDKKLSIINFLIFLVLLMLGIIQFSIEYVRANFGENYAMALIWLFLLAGIAWAIDPITKNLIVPLYRFVKNSIRKLHKKVRGIPFIFNISFISFKILNPLYREEPLFAMSFLEKEARKREKKEEAQKKYDELFEKAFGKKPEDP